MKEINPQVGELVKQNDGYCTCSVEKSEDTICPCKVFREEGICICGRYEK